jgi:hypothetical protein
MRAFVVSLLCSSCVSYHHAGAIEHATALGPIEISAQRVFGTDIPPGAVVLEYHFGNLADHSVPLDLNQLRVEIDGHRADLYDPRVEVQTLPLPALGVGTERLLYLAWGTVDATRVCVYLGPDCTEVLP